MKKKIKWKSLPLIRGPDQAGPENAEERERESKGLCKSYGKNESEPLMKPYRSILTVH